MEEQADKKVFEKAVQTVVDELKKTDWGKSDRGKEILKQHEKVKDKLKFPGTKKKDIEWVHKGKKYKRKGELKRESDLGGGEGRTNIKTWLSLFGGRKRAVESVEVATYHKDETEIKDVKSGSREGLPEDAPDRDTTVIESGDQSIPKDKLIDTYINELTNVANKGKYNKDASPPKEEEYDSWAAAKEAVQAYYEKYHNKKDYYLPDHKQFSAYGSHSNPDYKPVGHNGKSFNEVYPNAPKAVTEDKK